MGVSYIKNIISYGSAYIFRNVSRFSELLDKTTWSVVENKRKQSYVVTHEIQLNREEYKYFISNLNRTYDFVKEITSELYFTRQCEYVCALVYCDDKKQGVLVNSQGYTYPKMVAIPQG